jgi:hypothetical protein
MLGGSPLLAARFAIPLKPLLNLPYCQRRARVSSQGLLFYFERQSKKLLRKSQRRPANLI